MSFTCNTGIRYLHLEDMLHPAGTCYAKTGELLLVGGYKDLTSDNNFCLQPEVSIISLARLAKSEVNLKSQLKKF